MNMGVMGAWEVKAGDTEVVWKACYSVLERMEEVATIGARGVSR